MKLRIFKLMMSAGILAGALAHADSTFRITRYANLNKEQVHRYAHGDMRIFQKDLDFETRQAAKVCEMLHYPRVVKYSPVRFADVRGLAARFDSFAVLYKGMKPTITKDNLYVLKIVCEKTVKDNGSDHDHSYTPTPATDKPGHDRPDKPTPETPAPDTETKSDRTPEAPAPAEASQPPGTERTEAETVR